MDLNPNHRLAAAHPSPETHDSTLARQLADTLESMSDAFFAVDADGRITYVNKETERLWGVDRADVVGKPFSGICPQVHEPPFADYFRQIQTAREPLHFTERYPVTDRWFDVHAYPTDEGFTVYFRDVTEHHGNLARIREQAGLLDQASDAIVVRDLDQRITYWNKSAERLYGWTAEEVMGRHVLDLHVFEPSAYEAAMQTLLAKGEWSGELTQESRDGRRMLIQARWSLVRDETGAPRAILSTNSDITERKKLEQQFLRAQRMESIGTLASGIAHDLNNVLAPMLLAVGMLRQRADNEKDQRLLDMLEQNAQRGADMVRQVLAYARGVEGERAPVDLTRLLNALHQILRETFDRNLHIEVQAAPDLWQVIGDHNQIQQVLLNLSVNSRDAMPNGGTLQIYAENVRFDAHSADMHPDAQAGDYVRLRVVDSGTGIPSSMLDRIFDPFFTTKETGNGTGLGLATVQAVVKGHNGLITVYSEEGRGSEFHIYLPAHQTQEETARAAATSSELPRGQGQLLLVVDDEPAVRLITRQTLESFGYRVLVAEDGAGALALYAQHQAQIALVLTDMMMPVMDGYATIRALRRINPAVKVIAASGLGINRMSAKTANVGVHHFLQKPYTTEALLHTVGELLKEA